MQHRNKLEIMKKLFKKNGLKTEQCKTLQTEKTAAEKPVMHHRHRHARLIKLSGIHISLCCFCSLFHY